jgi:hypothetical protein
MLPLLFLAGAVGLVLSCLEKERDANEPAPQKAKKRKKNKSAVIDPSDIDDAAKSVPVSAPNPDANSVPADNQNPSE